MEYHKEMSWLENRRGIVNEVVELITMYVTEGLGYDMI